MKHSRRLAQVVVQVVFAEITPEGEIGATSRPVALTLSGAEWKQRWSTVHSRRVFAAIASQLDAQPKGTEQSPDGKPAPRSAGGKKGR